MSLVYGVGWWNERLAGRMETSSHHVEGHVERSGKHFTSKMFQAYQQENKEYAQHTEP